MGGVYKLGLASTVLKLVSSADAPNPFFASMQTDDVGFLARSIPGILAEGSNMETSMQSFSVIPPIGNLPLVVIESEAVMQVPGMPGLGEELKARSHADQLDLLSYSTNASYVLAESSGHNIPNDAPEVVVAAVINVLRQTAASTGRPDVQLQP